MWTPKSSSRNANPFPEALIPSPNTKDTNGKNGTSDAGTQPMPVHVPLDQKSPRVVALQLIKRFRDKRYRKHDDHRGKRKPSASGLVKPARANTNMGGTVPDDNCW